MTNPFLSLPYETALEDLGGDYYDLVTAAEFPQYLLRFRNDALLKILGLDPQQVRDDDFIEAFGLFQGVRPFLALRYHGYQFGEYNPYLGDGRGFLYGQVRGRDGELYDFGTKGSGRTPYSRTADGRLTLKGGVREVLAAEALHRLGVTTSRCLSLIETGESLWRGDEPSPTRSSVMVRFSRSHIRFGTFERLHFFQEPELIAKLLDHVIAVYYPKIDPQAEDRYVRFYAELVQRVATLAAQWMAAGFCHGVLNTDNMSIAGESFDYGPYAFIPTYNLDFTAAYFDSGRRYCYGNQPGICKLNLEMLQAPLRLVAVKADLEAELANFSEYYFAAYQQLMLQKLGFVELPEEMARELVGQTVQLLQESQVAYHAFFAGLAERFDREWRSSVTRVIEGVDLPREIAEAWCETYYRCLNELPGEEMDRVRDRLRERNPKTALLRPVIESAWEAIAQEDNWQPFHDLVAAVRAKD
ncbi:YdiU family protein [Oscillatoria sp. FACHB-1406]|uniref:protein adenylyltransferase SelO n=1 Tax=Oscillatoria sp. FACHB-1406 TaxID=2692846 RepID=UPI00168905FB|nr:YdiU family protein [Oscillatoria sp. FACHB-1406]MBD2578597.1 YdiU family protein [Oscillatoria sp. FACHB-1406]